LRFQSRRPFDFGLRWFGFLPEGFFLAIGAWSDNAILSVTLRGITGAPFPLKMQPWLSQDALRRASCGTRAGGAGPRLGCWLGTFCDLVHEIKNKSCYHALKCSADDFVIPRIHPGSRKDSSMIGLWELIIVAAVFLVFAFVLAAALVAIIFVVRANNKDRRAPQTETAPHRSST
jgi:hypothetical protein